MQQPIRVLIPGESREIYEKIYLAYWAEYKPETPSEADAVEDIINSRWKIRRFETIESNYFSMAGTLYQDNQEYKDSAPDTQQRASFNHLIETQPGFEACARFIERNQKAHSRALRNLDRIRKAAGKPKIEVSPNEVEKENPTNIPPRPQPAEIPKKDQNKVSKPNPPKREQGKANIELLLGILLFLSITIYGHKKLNATDPPSEHRHRTSLPNIVTERRYRTSLPNIATERRYQTPLLSRDRKGAVLPCRAILLSSPRHQKLKNEGSVLGVAMTKEANHSIY